jgi:uncharacterized protein YndB with AHSA1/START domain
VSETLVARRGIIIDAPAARVFAALTEPKRIVRWWGDDALYHMTEVVHELRIGGAVRYAGRFVGGVQDGRAFCGVGTYRVVEPNRTLEYTRLYPDGVPIAEETVIRYELEERRPVHTHLRVTHSGFLTEEGRAQHSDSWVLVLQWLRRYFEGDARSSLVSGAGLRADGSYLSVQRASSTSTGTRSSPLRVGA